MREGRENRAIFRGSTNRVMVKKKPANGDFVSISGRSTQTGEGRIPRPTTGSKDYHYLEETSIKGAVPVKSNAVWMAVGIRNMLTCLGPSNWTGDDLVAEIGR